MFFWYNAYSLILTDFHSRIYCWVGNGMEIWDSRAIENTKCQNDKIIFIFCRYQPQKYFPIFFLFSFFIVKFAIEARKCP
ncbi:hypothetical protein BACUNI_04190 [Bacteroides uniformis ATCC 8492]|uniref:Uncharacterized protein n=1 Tax=Bacteroides uniformis (strain ATCC 8492 / DSM 6597 / CCUG 4942 / CIP 103695 / JCM 5828 / KCTC 5204 / NCTC 13054 / VPI 0061) TaxID=411479 RepID=A0ABC9N7F9_BACUC|nr:hypothetical protein BACUNI_04190 [Bacteroides uniformis ATCC 8492]RHE35774.1 hypothetical protein DW749_09285 [Bacteroides uniformis]